MNRKPLFDLLRRLIGRPFRQGEVDAVDVALDDMTRTAAPSEGSRRVGADGFAESRSISRANSCTDSDADSHANPRADNFAESHSIFRADSFADFHADRSTESRSFTLTNAGADWIVSSSHRAE